MFILDPAPTFQAKVALPVPGQPAPVSVSMTFRHKTWRELNAWLARSGQYPSDVEFIGEVLEGWGRDIGGPDGQPLAYGPEALEILLDKYPGAGPAIVHAYRKELGDARVGN